MAIEIKVPSLGESVSTATVARWMKQAGDAVAEDEALVELETDKVTVEVNAPSAGVLEAILAQQGAEVEVGAVLATLAAGATAAPAGAAKPKPVAATAPAPAAAAAAKPAAVAMPAAAKLAADRGIDPATLAGTGKDGRVTKGDVLAATAAGPPSTPAPAPAPKPAAAPTPASVAAVAAPPAPGSRTLTRVRMTRLRATIARRLKEAQNTAAILTTFNEIDMSAVMALRSEYKDAFEKRHGVRLGFMGFFVKACVAAIREFPLVNGAIVGDEVVTHDYVDMGIAVSGPSGLVVPIVRNAESLSIAGIEAAIANLGRKARDNALTLEDMAGGTFSITNGGVFGSLMSTPILNPPQSAILGMHKIEERPVAIGGKVEVRPMMYVALSYDHRIVDGREAVSSLVRIKEAVEDPRRLLLEV
ncbi:MAG: 2-oxoglutarate dehydrogenase complex dihydrolipoyllysine-residue succinyltransferase [Acetobacteraceae bacterium]|nr:2-oxoglutarate dehydrogenase complex dihydrolipoyllysine-residue succinyltransferase [Acetobacteraceae bacterium]